MSQDRSLERFQETCARIERSLRQKLAKHELSPALYAHTMEQLRLYALLADELASLSLHAWISEMTEEGARIAFQLRLQQQAGVWRRQALERLNQQWGGLSEEQREAAAQEAFLHVAANRDKYAKLWVDAEHRFRTWLFLKAAEYCRRDWRNRVYAAGALPTTSATEQPRLEERLDRRSSAAALLDAAHTHIAEVDRGNEAVARALSLWLLAVTTDEPISKTELARQANITRTLLSHRIRDLRGVLRGAYAPWMAGSE